MLTDVRRLFSELRALILKEKQLTDQDKTREQLIREIENLRKNLVRKECEDRQASQSDLLKESEARYRAIVETISEPYAEHDIAGNLTYFNESYREEIGYSREEMQGINYRQYVNPKSLDSIFRIYHEIYKTGVSAKNLELESINKAGRKNFYECSVSLIRDMQGNPTGFRALYHNITERKQAEETVRTIQERLELVLEGAELGLYDVNSETGVSYIDDRYIEMLGYKREDFHAFNLSDWLNIIHPDDLASVKQRIREVMSGDRRLVDMEYRLRHKSGRMDLGSGARTGRQMGRIGKASAVYRHAVEHYGSEKGSGSASRQ